MPQPPLNRLNKLEKTRTRDRRGVFFLGGLWGTPAHRAAKRDRLIAGGTGRAGAQIIYIPLRPPREEGRRPLPQHPAVPATGSAGKCTQRGQAWLRVPANLESSLWL